MRAAQSDQTHPAESACHQISSLDTVSSFLVLPDHSNTYAILAQISDVEQHLETADDPRAKELVCTLIPLLGCGDPLVSFSVRQVLLRRCLARSASCTWLWSALSAHAPRLAAAVAPLELLRALLRVRPTAAGEASGAARTLLASTAGEELVRYQRLRTLRSLWRTLPVTEHAWLYETTLCHARNTAAGEWLGLTRARTALLLETCRRWPGSLTLVAAYLMQPQPQPQVPPTWHTPWGRAEVARCPALACELLGQLLLRLFDRVHAASAASLLQQLWTRRALLPAAGAVWPHLWALEDDELLVRLLRLLLEVWGAAGAWRVAHAEEGETGLTAAFAELWAGSALAGALAQLLTAAEGMVATALLSSPGCGAALLELLLLLLRQPRPLPAPPPPLAPSALPRALRSFRTRLALQTDVPFDPALLCARIDHFLQRSSGLTTSDK